MQRSLTAVVVVASGVIGSFLPVLLHAAAPPRASKPPAARPASGPPPERASSARALLDQYCVTCHNDTAKTAGLTLAALDMSRAGEHAELWEKVVQKLRSGAMPPAGARRPAAAEYDLLASTIEGALDRAAAAAPPPPAPRPSVARLNRAEYANAIRDLLAVDIDARALLPADDAGYGFDNIADVLSMTPALLERYLAAADKVSRLAIGNATTRPRVDTYAIHNDYRQDARMGEEFPFGTRGGMTVRHVFPADAEYVLRIRLQRQSNKTIGPIRGITERQNIEVLLDGVRLSEFAIGGPGSDKKAADNSEDEKADDALEVRFAAKTGPHDVTVTFVESGLLGETLTPQLPVRNWAYTYTVETQMGIEQVLIDGPYNVTRIGEMPSRRRIFSCYPEAAAEAEPCAATIVRALARRAYRRPVTDADVAPLLELYREGSARGGFEEGVRLALTRVLISPNFLLRVERAGDPSHADVTDLELASRLSFFLWSSIPDEELIDAAARHRLRQPAVFERQVKRMLADQRAAALISNFVGQWLYLRNMQLVVPDAKLFPDFDKNLRDALQRETELFVESQIKEDRGVGELLTANYTFLNERLARHYGIDGVYGSHFRRVTYSDDRRAGLLGQGSLLTATSYADRTSPVLRGKWVLENILGSPPPPPPPNVPSLDAGTKSPVAQTLRERMEQHRHNPVCASCHTRMDPIGFALENFDAIGRWRTTDGGKPIDPSGTLADGSKVGGSADLRRVLAGHRREFTVTVIEKMLTYALGRGVELTDMPAVRAIERDAAAHEYRWSSIILGVARSVPFQMRRPM